MARAHVRRSARLKRKVDAVLPPPPSPEDIEREEREFLGGWAAEIVAAAHHARERRSRGEPAPTPVDKMTGLEVCAEAVSYNGFAPPESVRLALRRLTHAESDGFLGDALTEEFNETMKAALSLAFAAFAEETAG
jgi:hypothetical protein